MKKTLRNVVVSTLITGVFFFASPVLAQSVSYSITSNDGPYYVSGFGFNLTVTNSNTLISVSGDTLTFHGICGIGQISGNTGSSYTAHFAAFVYGTSGSCNGNLDTFAAANPFGSFVAVDEYNNAYYFFQTLGGSVVLQGNPTGGSQAIDFSQIYEPAVFSTSSAAIAASSSAWASLAIASSTYACTSSDWIQNEVCTIGTYLFVPNPNTVQPLVELPSTLALKFPFSWVYGIQTTIGSLSASTTANFTSLSIGLGDLGIGSTTPMGNILPNFDAFSTTTLMEFMPVGVWDTGQLLISISLWLGLVYFIFHDARRRFHRV